jgi:hypothetical protein
MTIFEDFCARLAKRLRRRYVVFLEEEIARLRAENRALLNSLLGTAGVPSLDPELPRTSYVAPLRRRSWPQIAAALEAQQVQCKERLQRNASAEGRS